jgi:26S proteasome regulatory subunit N4
MSRIEKGLHQHHEALRTYEESKETQSQSIQETAAGPSAPTVETTPEPPFARVNSVAPSSPTHEAGLKAGDQITRFGPVHSRNHENLRKVAEVVQRSEGVSGCISGLLLFA